jgi:putative hydrolase of the HAD superfamily
MKPEIIAFDADDTLWNSEVYYRDSQAALNEILSPWAPAETVEAVTYEIETHNIPLYGYGIKSFTLSMLESAVKLSNGQIDGHHVTEILTLGRSMLEAEIELRPHVVETLEKLVENFRLMVITKGDLLDQTDKVERSGLAAFFSMVEVVNEKTTDSYSEILDRYRLSPRSFLMVGNSLQSDVVPVLELGGTAVHVPADTTWAYEKVENFDSSRQGFFELEHLGQLPALVDRMREE